MYYTLIDHLWSVLSVFFLLQRIQSSFNQNWILDLYGQKVSELQIAFELYTCTQSTCIFGQW